MSGQRSSYSRSSLLFYGRYWLRKGLHWAGEQPGAVDAAWTQDAPVGLIPITDQPAVLIAESGQVLVTGQPASLIRVFPALAADPGAVVVAGQAATLTYGRSVTASSGSVIVTGTPADFTVDRVIGATPGTVIVAGQPVDFRVGYTIYADPGDVQVNGQPAAVTASRHVDATSGTVVINGQPATIYYGYRVNAASGTVLVAGQPVSFGRTYAIAPTPGAVTVTGIAATITVNGRIFADPGAITVNGQPATVAYGRRLAVDAGTVAVTGQDAELDLGLGLAAEPGSVVVAGQPITFSQTRAIAANSGSVVVNGTAATLVKTAKLPLGSGTVVVVGQPASIARTAYLPAASGAVVVNGTPAAIYYGPRLVADPGAVVVNGQPIGFGKAIAVDPGSVVVNGQPAGLTASRQIAAAIGAVVVNGTAASLARTRAVAAQPGLVLVTGVNANLIVTPVTNPTLYADPGVVVVDGTAANLYKSYEATSMGSQLKNIVQFFNVPPGVTVSEPHKLQVNDVDVPPDVVYAAAASAFTIAANALNVIVTNNDVVPRSLDVLVEHWHTIERVFGGKQVTALTPQPLVVNPLGTYLSGTQEANTVIVDPTFGNDATGQRQQRPFATVAAALAAANSGDVVLVRPGVYSLPAGLVIPFGVALVGSPGVTLRMLDVASATTLVTLNEQSVVENVRLVLASSQHVNLTGIDFAGSAAATARVYNVRLEVQNMTAGFGASTVVGVRSSGNGVGTTRNLENTVISVRSPLAGTKRAILVDGANKLEAHNVTASATVAGIGVETSDVGAIFVGHGIVAEGVEADVRQTAGSLLLDTASELLTINAGGLGFTTICNEATQVWADPGSLPANGTRYLRPGTDTASATPIVVRLPSATLVKGISLRSGSAPGGSLTATVQRNGVDTAVAATLSGAAVAVDYTGASEGFAGGDEVSVKVDTVGSAASDLVCVLELF